MILQQLKADTNLDILAKALKAETGYGRASFALVREVASGRPHMLRGGDVRRFVDVGDRVTLKTEPELFVEPSRPRTLQCVVVKADRAPPFAWLAAKSVGAMLGGTLAAFTGLKLALGSGDLHALVAGVSVFASGAMAIGYYIKSCMQNRDNDVNHAFVEAARADSEIVRIASIEQETGVRWPRGEAPAAKVEVVPAIEHKPVAALPPPNNYNAVFLVSNVERAKVAR